MKDANDEAVELCVKLLDAYHRDKRYYSAASEDRVRKHDNVQNVARYLENALNRLSEGTALRLIGFERDLVRTLQDCGMESSPFYSAGLAVSLVRVLGLVGREASLAIVEPLCSGSTATAPQQRLVRAALNANDSIVRRVAEHRDRSLLVRAADAPQGDELLRPAAGSTSSTPADTLLRTLED